MKYKNDRFHMAPNWDAIIEVYKAFSEICVRHQLRYYVTDGNALGAVRHQGFIPWDDDLDVSMPRPDYEKFKRLAVAELPPNLKWVDRHNTSEFTYYFGKVQETREEYIHSVEKKYNKTLSNGVYIDVFPIDGYPTTFLDCLYARLLYLLFALIDRFDGERLRDQKLKYIPRWLLGAVLWLSLPRFRIKYQRMSVVENMLMSLSFNASQLTSRTCSGRTLFRRRPIPRDAWGEAKMTAFEELLVPLPHDVAAHLSSEYGGNFMNPPPPEKQVPTHTSDTYLPWWKGPTGK